MSFSKETVEIRNLLFIEERGKALLVEQHGRRVFLPRSQVLYIRKEPASMGGQPCMIQIPLWLAEEKNLSER